MCTAEAVRLMNKAVHVRPRFAKTCDTADWPRGGQAFARKLSENVLHLSVKGVHSNFRSELLDSYKIWTQGPYMKEGRLEKHNEFCNLYFLCVHYRIAQRCFIRFRCQAAKDLSVRLKKTSVNIYL